MTKAEQKKLDATASALRKLVVYASALPCADADAPAFQAVSEALDVLATLDAKPAPKRQRVCVWRFWYAAAMGLRMVDDSWGWPLAADVAPELRTWQRAKLVLRAGGSAQCVAAWKDAA